VGLILVILGNFFMIWSGLSQLAIGKGTPLPMVPTKKLVIKGPYSYCRNPMALGAILDYSGFSLLKGSISAIGLTVAFFFLVVLYIKLIEEKELELRFGEEYKNYKKNTPFIIPKLGRR
jgi:protein-S-isoprenylcysteine O-methyltransferase Ste14